MPPRYVLKKKVKRKHHGPNPPPPPKGNQRAIGNKGGPGQAPLYRPKFVEMAKKAAKAGFTDVEIGKLFGVSHTTIYDWKRVHPEFGLVLVAGKDGPDDRVERSLYDNAVSYEYEEEQAVYNPKTEQVEIKTVKKFHHGETTAQTRWLNNRRPDRWRDKHEFVAPEGMFEKRFTFNIFERNLDPNAPENRNKTIDGKFKRIENKQAVPVDDDDDGPVMP